jgi:hypothetical protein
MERLTKKISKTIQDKYSLGSYLQYDFANTDDTNKLLNKLGEFEDFMEANGFEELEELERLIGYPRFVDGYDEKDNKVNRTEFVTYKESFNEVFAKNKKLKQENQAFKDMWQKLKELLEKDIEHNQKEYDESFLPVFKNYSATENWVLDRMEELEKEGAKCQKK